MKKNNALSLTANEENSIHGGRGSCYGGRVFTHNALGGEAWRFIDFWRIPPGTSIGNHKHHNSRKLYCIVSGRIHAARNFTSKANQKFT